MIDLSKDIEELLEDTVRVERSFSKIIQPFPLCTLTVINNSSAAIIDSQERYSSVTYQLDVWDDKSTPKDCIQISAQVSEEMISAGFKRDAGKLMDNDPSGLQRFMMQFSGYVDNTNKKIYRGGF
jgi:hypothetical protein